MGLVDLPTWISLILYGKLVGKYTSHMDTMGHECVCTNNKIYPKVVPSTSFN